MKYRPLGKRLNITILSPEGVSVDEGGHYVEKSASGIIMPAANIKSNRAIVGLVGKDVTLVSEGQTIKFEDYAPTPYDNRKELECWIEEGQIVAIEEIDG